MPDDDQDHQSVQLRALLAFALSAVVLFVYQHYFVKSAPPPPPKPAVTESKPPAAPAQPAAAMPAKTPTGAPTLAASAEQTFLIETDTYLVSLSNHGAVVTSWTLKKYKDESGKPLELVNRKSALEVGFPFAYAEQSDLNQAFFRATTSPASGAATLQA